MKELKEVLEVLGKLGKPALATAICIGLVVASIKALEIIKQG